MTEHATPRQLLLDALVYVPAGLVLTVADELPRLAERGRHRLEGQVTTARVVGQFAVQFARRQVEERLGGRREPVPGRAAGSTSGPAPAASTGRDGDRAPSGDRTPAGGGTSATSGTVTCEGAPAAGTVNGEGPPAGDGSGGAPAAPPARRAGASPPAGRRARLDGTVAGRAQRTAPGTPVPGAGSVDGPTVLGIPGYDSLSASQVVQRLGGLGPAELRHVREHELAGRHRRTILNRVDQLLGGAADDGTGGDG